MRKQEWFVFVCLFVAILGSGCSPSLQQIKGAMGDAIKPLDDRLKVVERDVSGLKANGKKRDKVLESLYEKTQQNAGKLQKLEGTANVAKNAASCPGGQWMHVPVTCVEEGVVTTCYKTKCIQNASIPSNDPRLHGRRTRRSRRTRRRIRRSRRGVRLGRRTRSGYIAADDEAKLKTALTALKGVCKFKVSSFASGTGWVKLTCPTPAMAGRVWAKFLRHHHES